MRSVSLSDALRGATRRVAPPYDPIAPAAAAELLGCAARSIYRYVGQGRLRAWRVGGRLVLSEADVRQEARVVAACERAGHRSLHWRGAHNLSRHYGWRGGANERSGGELVPW